MDEIQAMESFRAELSRSDPEHMQEARARLRAAMRPRTSAEQYHRRRRIRGIAVAAAGVMALAAALALLALRDSGSGQRGGIAAEGSSTYPDQTISDVVSYADQVSVITAVSVTEVPDQNVDPEQAKADGYMVARQFTFRIDRTVWHRDGAPEYSGQFSSMGGAYWVKGTDQRKFMVNGAPWVEVGAQYLAPLALDNGKWSILSSLETFPVEDSVVAPGDAQHGSSKLSDSLDGRTVDEAGKLFAATSPDPYAAKHFDLRPSARVHAAMLDRERAGG